MSRSFKKTPISKDNEKSSARNKALANRAFRRRNKSTLYQRKTYKKCYDSWEIHDYVSLYTKEQAIEDYFRHQRRYIRIGYPTLESWLNYWEKCYRRK